MPGRLTRRIGSTKRVLRSYLMASQGDFMKTDDVHDQLTIFMKTTIIRSFEFDPDASCTECLKDAKVTIINMGLQVIIMPSNQSKKSNFKKVLLYDFMVNTVQTYHPYLTGKVVTMLVQGVLDKILSLPPAIVPFILPLIEKVKLKF